MSKLFTKSLLAIALTSTLAACGGGGEGSSTGTNTGSTGSTGGTTASLDFSLAQQSISMDELTQKDISVDVNYTGSGTLSYSYQLNDNSASSYSDISISNNTVSVSANDVNEDVSYSVDITLTDGQLTKTKTLNVSISDLDNDNSDDDNDDDNVVDTISLSLSSDSVTIKENMDASVEIVTDYSGSKDLSYSVTYSEDQGVSHNLSGSQLTFNANRINSDTSVVATVMVTDGTVSDAKEISIQLVNDLTILNTAKNWAYSLPFTMNELDNLLDYYIKAAYFAGNVKNSEKDSFASQYTLLKNQISEKNNGLQIQSLKNHIDDYESELISLSELEDKLESFISLVNEDSNQLVSLINQLSVLSDGSLPEIALDKYSYTDEYIGFSVIIGNEQTGSMVDGSWVLNDNYKFMNTLISALGYTSECESN